MSKKVTALFAIAAVIFDLIACIGDSNQAVYSIFMGLCSASFCIFVYGLFRVGFAKQIITDAKVKSDDSYRKAA